MWTFDSDTEPGDWVAVESPTNATLRDLTTTANGPVAVGDNGIVIGRGANRWGRIVENGPGARSRTLHAVDATDDGERVYFAGAGGAFGYYDLRTERRRDFSEPRGNANVFYSLTVAGDRGEEKFLVGDGSGNVIPGAIVDGKDAEWSWETAPNSGNAVEGLVHDSDGYGYAADVSSNLHVTTADEGWETIDVDDAQGSFYDCAFGDGSLLVGGGNGMVFEAPDVTERDGELVWTPAELGEFAIHGLDAAHSAQLACGEGGNVYLRTGDGEWKAGRYDGTQTFRACLLDEQMVAVGANGLIVERQEPEETEDGAGPDAGGSGSADDSEHRADDVSTERVTHDVPGDGADGAGNDDADTDDSADDADGSQDDTAGDGTQGSTDGTQMEWSDHDAPDAADDGSSGGDGGSGDGTTSGDGTAGGDGTTGDDSVGDDGSTGDEDGSGVDTAGWTAEPTRSPDGDNFDGRGENYDADEFALGEEGDSGNDPADESDGPDGNSGNDPSDPPDGGDGGDSGNDESDPADEDTDPDVDSPDS